MIGAGCWQLSDVGEACVATCGSGPQIDTALTVAEASSTEVVQALWAAYDVTLEAAGLDEPCGDVPKQKAGEVGSSIMNSMNPFTSAHAPIEHVYALSTETNQAGCWKAGNILKLAGPYRTPCACQTVDPVNVPKAVGRGLLAAVAVSGGFTFIGFLFDLLDAALTNLLTGTRSPKWELKPVPDKPFKSSWSKKGMMIFSALLQLLDEITDIRVLVTYAQNEWWGFFWVSLTILITSSFACMLFAGLDQPMRPTVGDRVVVIEEMYRHQAIVGKITKDTGSVDPTAEVYTVTPDEEKEDEGGDAADYSA